MNAAIHTAVQLDKQRDLAEHLKNKHAFTGDDVLYYMREVEGGLAYTHKWIHRNEAHFTDHSH